MHRHDLFCAGPRARKCPAEGQGCCASAQPSEPNRADLKAGGDLSMVDNDAVKSPWEASIEGSKHRLVRVWSKAGVLQQSSLLFKKQLPSRCWALVQTWKPTTGHPVPM